MLKRKSATIGRYVQTVKRPGMPYFSNPHKASWIWCCSSAKQMLKNDLDGLRSHQQGGSSMISRQLMYMQGSRACHRHAAADSPPLAQVSDNTRHLAKHPKTGEPFLLPADQIRRVVLCSGQIYYALSNARRAKRIRDVVFVRLEQIAPFPHDLLVKVQVLLASPST